MNREHPTSANERTNSMNIFYAPPEKVTEDIIELTGQEAVHASKALRYRPGDSITVVDGKGGWYEGEVGLITSDRVQVTVEEAKRNQPLQPSLTLAMGIIKKRDRLEFAVEKAVELGVKEVVLFRGEHSVKQNIRTDRLESIILSAMKQSLQSWLPKLSVYNSLQQATETYANYNILVAHQEGRSIRDMDFFNSTKSEDYLMVVGPEGGFSDSETDYLRKKEGEFISFNSNRLRAETAVVSFLSVFRAQ